MLVTALKKERKEIFEKGKMEGKIEGKTEGKVEVAKGMLSKGMQISLISEITALPKEQIEQLKSSL